MFFPLNFSAKTCISSPPIVTSYTEWPKGKEAYKKYWETSVVFRKVGRPNETLETPKAQTSPQTQIRWMSFRYFEFVNICVCYNKIPVILSVELTDVAASSPK